MNSSQNIDTIFHKQLQNNSPVSLKVRMEYLIRIEKWINSHKQEIKEAHYEDLRKPESEIELAEIWFVLSEIKIAKKNTNVKNAVII